MASTTLYVQLFCGLLFCASSFVVHAQTGPGGVGNSSSNKIWLKADEGILDPTANASVGLWVDQSGNGFNADQSEEANKPTYQISGSNNQPYIHFDRTNGIQYFQVTSVGVGTLFSNSNTIFIVGKANSGGADSNTNSYQSFLIIPGYHSGIAASGYPETSLIQMPNWLGSSIPGTPTSALGNTASISQGSWNMFTRRITENVNGTTMSGFSNGSLINVPTSTLQMTNYTQNIIRIGAGFTSGTYTWALNGDISEIIVYNTALNEAERIIVENYLSSKYNHTIQNDKYGFDGPNEYHHDVAGIGREDVLNQHLSCSSNLININSSGLDDGEYALIGHNRQSVALNNTDAPAGKKRLNRVWKVDLTGDPGPVSISFRVNNFSLIPSQSFFLLVDSDGTFSNATQYSGTVANGLFTVDTPVSLIDGGFVTLAYGEVGPGAPVSMSYDPKKILLTYGTGYTTQQPFIEDGGAAATFSLPNPPLGISIDETTGSIAVGATTPAGTYSLSVVATNTYGSNVFSDAITFTIYPFEAATLDYPPQTVSIGNAIEPLFPNFPSNAFQYAVASGSLNGLNLNSVTGEISGSLQSEGTISAIVRATPVSPNATGSPIVAPVVISAIGSSGPAGVGSPVSNKVWLDASYLTGVTNGTGIPNFQDRSGNGWNAIQNTASRRPIYFINQLNGKPAIRFDRSSTIQYMELTAAGIGAMMSNSNTIFTIAKANTGALDNNTNSHQAIITVPGYHSTIAFTGYPTTTGVMNRNHVGGTIPGNPASTYVSSVANVSQGTWHLISRTIAETSKTTLTSFLNGSQTGPASVSSLAMTNYTNNIVRIGSANVSGSYSWPLNGFLTEVVMFNASLNEAQRIIIENYLAAKYDLSIANDRYMSNDATYTLDVEGIGTTDGTNANKHSIASNGKGLKLEEANTSLNATNEFLFAGHALNVNATTNADLPTTISERWQRVWYVEKTGSVDAKLSFDISDAGLPADVNLVNEFTQYQLLYRAATTGEFMLVSVSPALENDDQLSFTLSDVQLINGYYTLGKAQGLVWTGAQDQDWNKAGNWNLDRVPTENDKVIINDCSVCPLLGNSISIAGLVLNSGSKIEIGSHQIVVTGASFLNEASVESSNGKIQSTDFIEVKNSVFQGIISIEKTGGSSNAWYGGNTFSPELKLINSSNNTLQVTTQENNIIQNP